MGGEFSHRCAVVLMNYQNPEALVTTEWLADNLGRDDVVVFDGTSHLPTTGRNGNAEFLEKHIPGALRFDIDDIADPDTSLSHMLPGAELFAAKLSQLGVRNSDHVIVYDVYGLQSAARAWWMMRIFGHDHVSLLSGGLPKWEAEGRATEAGTQARPASTFSATLRPALVRDINALLANVTTDAEQVADARAAGRFTGVDPEPRAGMRSGHIPNSHSLPFTTLLDGNRIFLDGDQLKSIIEGAGIQLDKPLVATCGSGVTACVIALACHLIGKSDVAIYDGSWSKWGTRQDTPVASD